MQDHPDATELLRAVREFLETEVVPRFEGRRRFHALVAANVLAILEREWADEESQLVAEWARLAELLGRPTPAPPRLDLLRDGVRVLSSELTERIRRGHADTGPFGDAVRRHLRETTREKLRIANPRRLGST